MMKRNLALTLLALLTINATPDVRPGWLGIAMVPGRDSRIASAPITWLQVRRISPTGPAARIDLRPGDVIAAVEGKKLAFKTDLDMLQFLSEIRAGRTIMLDIMRGSQKRRVTITAAEMDDVQFELHKHNIEVAKQRDAQKKK